MPEMDAISLRPLLKGKTNVHREYVVSGLNEWRMAFDGRFKLVTRPGKPPVLFDVQADPWEDVNVAERHPEIVARYGGSYVAHTTHVAGSEP